MNDFIVSARNKITSGDQGVQNCNGVMMKIEP